MIIKEDLSYLRHVCSILGGAPPITTHRSLSDINQDPTPSSYVPFRNGIFLAHAVALGESRSIPDIYSGANGLHSGVYPDDTAPFAHAFTKAARIGTSSRYQPCIHFPFAHITKPEIVAKAIKLAVNLKSTVSCYQPTGIVHCGVCDSCIVRQDAMQQHGLTIQGHPIDRSIYSQ
jgi:7-cyano-7-deazaguanine synthase